MVVFEVSVDGKPEAASLTLEGAMLAMEWLPRGQVRVTFTAGGQVLHLTGHAYLIDHIFRVTVS